MAAIELMSKAEMAQGKGASCAKCGHCCEEIYIDSSHERLLKYKLEKPPEGYEARDPQYEDVWKLWDEYLTVVVKDGLFMVDHWHPILDDGVQRSKGNETQRFAYTCDAYDSDAKLCTARDERPSTCSRYPWYGEPPSYYLADHELYKRCSFWHDVPREEWPEGTDPLPCPSEAD